MGSPRCCHPDCSRAAELRLRDTRDGIPYDARETDACVDHADCLGRGDDGVVVVGMLPRLIERLIELMGSSVEDLRWLGRHPRCVSGGRVWVEEPDEASWTCYPCRPGEVEDLAVHWLGQRHRVAVAPTISHRVRVWVKDEREVAGVALGPEHLVPDLGLLDREARSRGFLAGLACRCGADVHPDEAPDAGLYLGEDGSLERICGSCWQVVALSAPAGPGAHVVEAR